MLFLRGLGLGYNLVLKGFRVQYGCFFFRCLRFTVGFTSLGLF